MTKLLLPILVIVSSITGLHAQERGEIIQGNLLVLDPNQDGFITTTGAAFSTDGYYVDEFELPMFGLPISESGEALNDIQAGSLCGTTDLAVDSLGHAVYGLLDDNNNLIFRFRLAGDRPSVEAYTILIDTDQALGALDPNATPDNPGFEIDITFVKNASKGVYVYNIDGIESCPTSELFYPFADYFQKSIAGTDSCDDPDYFYDFYVPFADLQATYGLTLQTELRFVAVTNVSATCALGGNISDVGGVDDTQYGGCNTCAWEDLSEAQCPTSLDNLCDDCGGFLTGPTPKPEIDVPIKVGSEEVTGVSLENAFIYLSLFNAAGSQIEQDTVNASAQGIWEIPLSVPLAFGDSVTVKAQGVGQCQSGVSQSDLTFAIAIYNLPPTLSGAAQVLGYTENASPIALTSDMTIGDTDGVEMDSLVVQFSVNYSPSEDVISYVLPPLISVSEDLVNGVIKFYGTANVSDYQNLLSSISYSNSSENPDESQRTIEFYVNDGLDASGVVVKEIVPARVNDIPTLSGSTTPITYTTGSGTVDVDGSISLVDLDHPDITEAKVMVSNNFIAAEDVLIFIDQNGISGSYDAGTSTWTLTGTASLAFYEQALLSIQFNNTNPTPDESTRQVSFEVFDGTDWSLPHYRFIDFDGFNGPPVILDDLGVSADTIFVNTAEDVPIEICLDVLDPQGDALVLSSDFDFNNGVVTGASDLCFVYEPNSDFNSDVGGIEYEVFVVCDLGIPSLCDTVVVAIDVTAVDDPPIFVDSLVSPIDTLYIVAFEDEPFEFCVDIVDPEGDPAELTQVVSLSNQASYTITSSSNLCISMLSNPGYIGQEISEITVCQEGTGLCSVLVLIADILPTDDPPSIIEFGIEADTVRYTISEDSLASLCVEILELDGDDAFLIEASSISGNSIIEAAPFDDLCFAILPSTNFNGIEYGIIKVCDIGPSALCDSVIVEITVIAVDDPPVFIDSAQMPIDTLYITAVEDELLEICVDAEDPEGDEMVLTDASSISGNAAYSITSGSRLCFSLNSNPDYNGNETGEITVCQLGTGLCATLVLIVDILPADDPPVIAYNALETDTLRFTIDEDNLASFCVEVLEVDGDNIAITDAQSILGNGGFDATPTDDLCFDFQPNLNFFGIELGVITACDVGGGNLCDSVIVEVTVINIDDPPLFGMDTIFISAYEDSLMALDIPIMEFDGDSTEITAVVSISENAILTAEPLGDMKIAFLSNGDFTGMEYASVVACDIGGSNMCDSVILAIDVINVNDKPEILYEGLESDSLIISTDEDTPIAVSFQYEDIDETGTPQFSITSNTVNGSFQTLPNFTFEFIPLENYFGIVEANLVLCDTGTPSLCDTVLVVLNVLPVNDAPTAINDTVRVLRRQVLSINVLANDFDLEGDAIFVSSISGPASHASVTIEGDSVAVYSPLPGYSGMDSFEYTICEIGDATSCSSAMVIVEVYDIPIRAHQGVSPNGDGINDTWVIEGIELFPGNRVRVFDRYNNRIFETKDYNNDSNNWNGKPNKGVASKQVANDTYYYVIDLADGQVFGGYIVVKSK